MHVDPTGRCGAESGHAVFQVDTGQFVTPRKANATILRLMRLGIRDFPVRLVHRIRR